MIVRSLLDLGWTEALNAEFESLAAQGWVPARLIRDNKITYGALHVNEGCFEEVEVVLGGKVYHEAATDADLPAVGDWVALELGGPDEDTVIRARLTRRNRLSRKAAGQSTEEQVMVANVDVVVVVTEAGPDFNPRRMERFFAIIGRSGAQPVVLLNKCDLYDRATNQAAAAEIMALNPGAHVHITSAHEKKGLKALKPYFQKGATVALIGSSGVGKSALINQLLGGDEFQWTGEVNETTGKGRHTTTARELMVLRQGGIIVDNPGIREVQMWTDETTLRAIIEVHFPGLKAELVREALTAFFQVRELPTIKKKPSTSELLDWLKLLLAEDIPIELLREKNAKKLIPPLYGALLKNEADVHLFEKLAFMARRQG